MKHFMIGSAAALALLGSWPAAAADLQVKATAMPRARVLQTYMGCGTFYGIHTTASGARTEVQGTPGTIGNTYNASAAVGLNIGYLCGDGVGWKAIEVDVDYKGLGETQPATNTAVDGSIASRWGVTGRFMLGGPIANMLGVLPNLGPQVFPALPQAPANSIPSTNHPYLFAAVHADDVSGSIGMAEGKAVRIRGGIGVGLMSELGMAANNPQGSRVVANTSIEYLFPGNGVTLGGIDGSTGSANLGPEYRLRFGLNY